MFLVDFSIKTTIFARIAASNLSIMNCLYPSIAIPGIDGLTFIYQESIVYALSDGHQTHLCMKNGSRITLHKGLKEVLEALPKERFVRVHHSHAINLQHINQFQIRNNKVLMSNGEWLAVARSKRQDFLERFVRL